MTDKELEKIYNEAYKRVIEYIIFKCQRTYHRKAHAKERADLLFYLKTPFKRCW